MNRHDIFWQVATRIHDTYREQVKGEEAYAYSEDAARELQDAGLLAPDLPEPNIHGEWELTDGITVTADDDEIAITAPIKGGHTIICWYGNPGQAQELAHTLLAATHHPQERQ